jgi:hypothetical protein
MLRMQETYLRASNFKTFLGGHAPKPPRKGMACGHTSGFQPKSYSHIEMLNPPLKFENSQ